MSGAAITRPMRSKEEAHDYRYFPDPDLLPLVLDSGMGRALRAGLPELPDAKKARFIAALRACRREDAAVLVAEQATRLVLRTGRRGTRCQGRGQLGHAAICSVR